MKQHNCIIETKDGELQKEIIFSNLSARDLKAKNENIVAIKETLRVKHPSPDVMQTALAQFNVDLESFYAHCYAIAATSIDAQPVK